MGCGGSKLDPDHDSVPAGLRPILRRRLEDIRARRNGTAANGLSKKELLGDGGTNDHSSAESTPEQSYHNTQESPPSPQKLTTAPSSPICSSTLLSSSHQLPEEDHQFNSEEVDQGSVNNAEISQFIEGKIGNNEEEIVEEREKRSKGLNEEVMLMHDAEDEQDMMMVAPSSPSFRVYCNSADKQEFEGYMDDDEHIIVEGDRMLTRDESTSSNEVSVKMQKKPRRGTMFKKMIPKGGKFKQSFYNFPCSSNANNNSQHLLQKAAA